MSVRVSAQGLKVLSVKFRYGLEQKRMKLGVYAAPVYLKCQLTPDAVGIGGEDLAAQAPMDVTLNEDTGMVTYTFAHIGRAFTVRGVFTSDRVTFNGFSIDRTNLEFQRDLSGIQVPGRPPIIDHGHARVAAYDLLMEES